MINYDIDALITLKNSLSENDLQWVKTTDQSKIGKIVRVVDVIPLTNNRFIAVLSDGTRLDTDEVHAKLMMVTEDQPPLTMPELYSINEYTAFIEPTNTEVDSPTNQSSQIIQTNSTDHQIHPNTINKHIEPSSIFGLFELHNTLLKLAVTLNMPSTDVLKVMYINSKNKDEFISGLSDYVYQNITKESISQSIIELLSKSKKTK